MTQQPTEPDEEKAAAEEKSRRRRLLLVTLFLLIGLPIYLLAASFLAAAVNPVVETPEGPARALHWSVEILVFLALGLVWALPLKPMVKGLAKRKPR